MPDTFFRNEKEGAFHEVILPNLYIRIYPNGDVLYSIRWGQIISQLASCYGEQDITAIHGVIL